MLEPSGWPEFCCQLGDSAEFNGNQRQRKVKGGGSVTSFSACAKAVEASGWLRQDFCRCSDWLQVSAHPASPW